ncbi:putative calmodulin-like protein 2 [Tripterygium wilfordii]|uniref:Putative calmodulin-like protein 2 n=1 Tax=Tripterygium wilfordii TaxID=458696 RepID=A0A7J7CSU9_TRIWF|nr:calcium-binding protein CP1-like [Tripterygium wilfordii]KAF5737068.1 putative calmodulin-like protein 2 [Tripterygium wilfordii]
MCPSGRIVSEEAGLGPDFRAAFDVLDADRDGKISREDLQNFYSGIYGSIGCGAEEDVIGSMITAADFNRNGFVEYDEFERVLRAKGRSDNEMMEEAFKVMDVDGDGIVGHEDLKRYMERAGFDASDEDIKAMIRLGGSDGKEGVTYHGLLKILAIDN